MHSSFTDQVLDLAFAALGLIFKKRWVAPLIFLPVFLVAAAGIWWWTSRQVGRWLNAADQRLKVLREAIGDDPDVSREHGAFYDNFDPVEAAMGKDGPGAHELVRAWAEFRETIVDVTQNPIRNTARPSVFFSRSAPSLARLGFWSNVFVGLGLVLTFFGIVVALNETASAMQGGDVRATQAALHELLIIASAKFFSSIAGIIASLMMRFAERGLNTSIRKRLTAINDLLERGLLYVSPQAVAVQQLNELERQSAQLERFNADLAITIGEQVGARFQAAVAPIGASLGVLNDSINAMGANLKEGLGQSAAEAVSAAASGELKALGETLNRLGERLEGLGSVVGGSGEEAARLIRLAGADFAAATKDIRAAFEGLTVQVADMGQSLTEQTRATATAQSEAVGQALETFRSAQDEMARSVETAATRMGEASAVTAQRLNDEMSTAFDGLNLRVEEMSRLMGEQGDKAAAAQNEAIVRAMAGFQAAQEQMARAAEAAAGSLGQAGAKAARRMNHDMAEGISATARQSQELLRQSVAEAGASFKSANDELVEAVRQSADRITALASAIERGAAHASSAAEAFQKSSDGARGVALELGGAAKAFGEAATPAAQASRAMSDAAERVTKAVQDNQAAAAASLAELQALARGIKETQAAAAEAWHSYRGRFEQIDQHLEGAFKAMVDGLGATLSEFKSFSTNVDVTMASAVKNLAASMQAIEEIPDALRDLRDWSPPRRPEAAE